MGTHHSIAERFTMIVCPYPLIVRRSEIFLARRQGTAYMPGKYSLPAGHEEANERMMDCLVREVKEEVGIRIDPIHPRLVHVMHRNELDVRMDLFFLVTQWKGVPKICEPHKCDAIGWFPFHHLPETTVPYIKAAIEAWQKGILYQEWGWTPFA
jgi:mutator protein MutT